MERSKILAATHSKNAYQFVRGQVAPESTIIAIGGGKGGIGKSFVSSSVAIFLANQGHETYLVDLDLGGANLHTTLGEGLPKLGINEFVTNPSLSLTDIAVKTAHPNLKLIAGSSDQVDVADITDFQRTHLMSSLFKLKSKYIVLDLSAGTHHTTLDFFLLAQHKICVFTPEPSSIENAYRFLKGAFYRKIRRYETQLQLNGVVTELMAKRDEFGLKSPADLLKAISQRAPDAGIKLQSLMNGLNFEVILNQARTLKDVELGPSIQGVCTKYFGMPFNYLGHVEHDNAVWQALRKRRHLIYEYPHSKVYAQMMSITRRLAGAQSQKGVVL